MPFPPRAFLVTGPKGVPLLLPDIPLTELIPSLSKLRLFLVLDAILSFQKSDLTYRILENQDLLDTKLHCNVVVT